MQTVPLSGSRCPAPSIALMNAMPKLPAPPITSPVDFISGPRIVSTPGKRTNGNTGLFTNTPAGVEVVGHAELRERLAGHHPRGDLRQRQAVGLRER